MEKACINNLTVKEKLLNRGVYYIVEVRPENSRKKRGDVYLVLATSEKAAMNKIKRCHGLLQNYDCIGIFNKKNNTILLKNADKICDISKLTKIED